MIVVPALIFAFAGFCIWLMAWLTVRIINHRERWAKWTAVGVVLLVGCMIALYVGHIFANGLHKKPMVNLYQGPIDP